MNNGGIRAGPPGRAGRRTEVIFEIQPFGNTLYRLTVRGRDLRAYLERLVGTRRHQRPRERREPRLSCRPKPPGSRISTRHHGRRAAAAATTRTTHWLLSSFPGRWRRRPRSSPARRSEPGLWAYPTSTPSCATCARNPSRCALPFEARLSRGASLNDSLRMRVYVNSIGLGRSGRRDGPRRRAGVERHAADEVVGWATA